MVVTLDGKDAGRRPFGATHHCGTVPGDSPAALPARFAHVRGVLFEMGGVLYDDSLWHRWLVNLLHRLGVQTPFRAFCHLWRDEYRRDVHSGRRDYDECLGELLRAVGLTGGQIDEVIVAAASRRRELTASHRLLPGVARTLAQLRSAGLSLGVLTDGLEGGHPLDEQLAALGIDGCFDAAVSSRETGCTKPDPRSYLQALGRLGLPAEAVAFVGSDQHDLQGAAAAGLATVAVNFDGTVAAEAHAARFDDLLWMIGRPPRALAG